MPESRHQTLTRTLDWEWNFTARTLARGRAYAREGRVHDLQIEPEDGTPGTAHLRARVRGSGETYICTAEVANEGPGTPTVVDADCTCPVGFMCKHAAAMMTAGMAELLRVLMGPAPGPAPEGDIAELALWLRSVQPVADTESARTDPERRFGLLLAGSEETPAQLLALPAWLRPSRTKSGRSAGHWVDPKPVEEQFDRGIRPQPEAGWPAEVELALTALLASGTAWGRRRWPKITTAAQEQALEILLARYPVWFERGSVPLKPGPELDVPLEWQVAADGQQHLVARLPDAHTRILFGVGAWYVSAAAGHVGRVRGDAAVLRQLHAAPSLSPAAARDARASWQSSPRLQNLPPPQDLGAPEVIRAAPVPVLSMRLIRSRDGADDATGLAVARFGFDYAGMRTDPASSAAARTRWEDGRLLEITPDLDAERRWIRLLPEQEVVLATDVPWNLRRFAATPWSDYDLVLLDQTGHDFAGPAGWQPLLDRFAAEGAIIEYAADYPHQQLVAVESLDAELKPAGQHWFEVSLGIEIQGERIDLLPILRRLIADPAFPRHPAPGEAEDATWRVPIDADRRAELPLSRLRALIEPLLEWLETEPEGDPRVHVSRLEELQDLPLPWRGGTQLAAALKQLAAARKPASAPRSFKATLRPYQRDGLAWLGFLAHAGLGGILADDMGLGKTVQVLAHLAGEKSGRRLRHPALVVVPTSLVGNWADEAARFAPRLRVLILHGPQRHADFARIPEHDLVITTYPLLPRDRDALLEQQFSLLVLDEAQAIKNPRSQAARVVRELDVQRRLAVTGTPLENHLGELWAQFDAVEPGLLGSERRFRRHYRTPIEKHGDAERQAALNRRIGALMLRRRKEDVLPDLPAKTEILRLLELDGPQRELYESLRLAQHERVREAIRKRGFAQAGIVVLDALLKLRQACCDPRLVKLEAARKLRRSVKLDAALALVDGLMAEGRQVLLFSQFTSMLDLLAAALAEHKIAFAALTGKTPARERSALVRRFQRGEVPLLLISLKAGGTGLNLTAADSVIHYDPWWNPAVEAQATDRAHRIGQDKPVFVYRLICKDTVEEKIQQLQARKAELARAVLEGGSSSKLRFNEDDIEALLGS